MREGAASAIAATAGERTRWWIRRQAGTPRASASASAIAPETVRASSTPSSSPVITTPRPRPSSPGPASSGASGTIMCVTAAVMPIATLAATSTGKEGARPAATKAKETAAKSSRISFRRRLTSPRGTNSRMRGRITELRGYGDNAPAAGRYVEGAADLKQHRLVVVNGSDAGPASQRQKWEESPMCVVRCGRRIDGSGPQYFRLSRGLRTFPKLRSPRARRAALLHPVVGRFLGDDHVVDVAFAQAGGGDCG